MDRGKLTTEKRNRRSREIDRMTSVEIVELINAEDRKVARAVRCESQGIARVVDRIVASWRAGGRLIYVGAGTSGRLGVLDASECPPTFGSRPGLVQGVIAGGRRALVKSVEGAEDRRGDGAEAMRRRKVGKRDVVVGIAACGLTPYVLGAVEEARKAGAWTAFITCAPEVAGKLEVDEVITVVVGPEVVTGSSRMKAGTATKLVLNTLTTAAMVRSGKVYGNLMVDLRAVNAKLQDRAERIVMTATGVGRASARRLLREAQGRAKEAILMEEGGLTYSRARRRLAACDGVLRKALGGDGEG